MGFRVPSFEVRGFRFGVSISGFCDPGFRVVGFAVRGSRFSGFEVRGFAFVVGVFEFEVSLWVIGLSRSGFGVLEFRCFVFSVSRLGFGIFTVRGSGFSKFHGFRGSGFTT